jgi:hypothetical protein
MCVVRMHIIYRHQQTPHNQLLCGAIMEEDSSVILFSDLLFGNLKVRVRQRQTIQTFHLNGNESILTQILHDGSKNWETSMK